LNISREGDSTTPLGSLFMTVTWSCTNELLRELINFPLGLSRSVKHASGN